jgi:hypothetical protein
MNLYTLKELGILKEEQPDSVIDIGLITGIFPSSTFGYSVIMFQPKANYSQASVKGTPEEVRNKIREFKSRYNNP